jgi:hypothetical protein
MRLTENSVNIMLKGRVMQETDMAFLTVKDGVGKKGEGQTDAPLEVSLMTKGEES